MATKYSIQDNNGTIEFSVLADAQLYKETNGLSSEIITIEYTPANDLFIPSISARQIRQALILSGISLDDIKTAIASLPEPTKSLAEVEWEYSTSFRRDRPILLEVSNLLGWASDDLDQIWILASTL